MMTSKSADAGDGDWPCANIVSTIARNAATQRKISFIIERRYRTPILAQKSMNTKPAVVSAVLSGLLVYRLRRGQGMLQELGYHRLCETPAFPRRPEEFVSQ